MFLFSAKWKHGFIIRGQTVSENAFPRRSKKQKREQKYVPNVRNHWAAERKNNIVTTGSRNNVPNVRNIFGCVRNALPVHRRTVLPFGRYFAVVQYFGLLSKRLEKGGTLNLIPRSKVLYT
eukprot:6194103-Amphidinium_carterae.1